MLRTGFGAASDSLGVLKRRSCLGMSSLSRRKISLKIPSPGQHGGSLKTRFYESMRAHVITICGKRTLKP